MNVSTRRRIIEQVTFIETESHSYSLGANSIKDTWTMISHKHSDALYEENGEYHYYELDPVTYQIVRKVEGTIVDEWRHWKDWYESDT